MDSAIRKTPVTKNLLLWDIKPKFFSDEFDRCMDINGLMYIKGCRRDVLIGSSEDLEEIPLLSAEGVSVYEGAQAYSHLLTYVTGLISRTRGESQIVSQFKRAYGELKTRDTIAAKNLHRLFRSIIHDNSVIRNHVTQSLKPAFYEACAHELSDQKGQEVVLVVANTNKNGMKPDAGTKNIVRYLGNNRKNAATTIIFTHPDADSLRNVYSYFLSQKIKGKISSQIKMLPFEQSFDATADLQHAHRVYVCFTMGVNVEADKKMLSEWRQREALGGKLIHLGGSAKTDRRSTGIWSDPELFYYVSPEDISKWQETRKDQNEQTIKDGMAACDICADLRNENQRPSAKRILEYSIS